MEKEITSKEWTLAGIAVIILFLYIALFGYSFIKTINATTAQPTFSTVYSVILTAVSGGIGGIVATSLGVDELPDPLTGDPEKQETLMVRVTERAKRLGKNVIPNSPETLYKKIGIAYIWVYLGMGLIGLAIALLKSEFSDPSLVPELLLNISMTVVALMLAVLGKMELSG